MRKNFDYLELWEKMTYIRMVEEAIAARYQDQKMRCPTHLSIGQELPSAIFGLVSEAKDYAVSSHRCHAHYLAKGCDLKAMISEIHGKDTGCSRGFGGSMHLGEKSSRFMGTSAIVGNGIPIGVGLAMVAKQEAEGVAFTFLGDGSIEEGVFYESVNFAVLKKLPAIFICENNLYSVYSDMSVRQPNGRDITDIPAALGCASVQIGFGDIDSCYSLFAEAVEHARNGHGPQFIEIETYRWREHCGPNYDNDIGYRDEAEYLNFKSRDPLDNLSNQLKQNNDYSRSMAKFIEDLKTQIDQAFDHAETSEFGASRDISQFEYAGS